jgi:uncharacterized YccA/Bax inhibitor family protein
MESSNPVFGNAPALKAPPVPTVAELEEMLRAPRRLTMDAIVEKTALLLGLVVATGAIAWIADVGAGLAMGAMLAGLVLAMVNIFKKQVSPGLVLAYAACEGVFLGAVSRYMDAAYSGIAAQAAVGTTAIFATVLWAYKSGRLRATPRFTKVVVGAFVGMFAMLLVNYLAAWIGGGDGLGLRSGGGMAILFSLGFIVVGALTFVLDFDAAERLVEAGVPEREAWRVAFGLTVTLVWLYLEVMRLISYFRD